MKITGGIWADKHFRQLDKAANKTKLNMTAEIAAAAEAFIDSQTNLNSTNHILVHYKESKRHVSNKPTQSER